MIPFLEDKIKLMSEKLEKGNLVSESIDLDNDVFTYINELATTNNTSLEIIVNVLLTEYLIQIEKENYLKDENSIKKIMDIFEYIELLESDEEMNEPIIVINYNDIKHKVVSLPPEMYKNLKKEDK